MRVTYKTDIGRKRTHNEDSMLVDEPLRIFLIADGMGDEDISKLLVESLLKSHHTVRSKSTTDVNLAGMGTTLIQMLVTGNNAHICHVGDSRAYLLRNEIKRITQDHTSEMYFVNNGATEEGYLPVHKMRVLTQAVGGQATPLPEVKQVKLKPKDILLLCSDGLTDMLSDEQIESIIQRYRDNLAMAADHLIKEANDKGGVDNISVILIEYE
ncbi:MAG: serine/threonine-protein phosphatase [Planctomycetes bacterium]|nr:serine/threonine-protein phosphatase [Planctomycetota bacterium]